MHRGDYDFGQRVLRDLEARRVARRLLEVAEGADAKTLKRAYRRASLRYHPDRNPGDAGAARMFVLAKGAYELLAEDKPCPMLLESTETAGPAPEDEEYELYSSWGHFLWWRKKFFGGPYW
jgi:Golgi nucleoside diphosphatase